MPVPRSRLLEHSGAFELVGALFLAHDWRKPYLLVPAVLASSAVPGLLPPVPIDGEHFIDGGVVNSIPVGRAVELGATTVWVLQVGRVDRPLQPPRKHLDVAQGAPLADADAVEGTDDRVRELVLVPGRDGEVPRGDP